MLLYDSDGIHYLDNVDVGGVTIRPPYRDMGFEYLLGLINSRLINWYFKLISARFRGGWMSANRQFISQLPIRTIDFNNPDDKARHDRMVAMVDNMLAWKRQLAAAQTPQEKAVLERQIAATDRMIDQLVYELYGLTDEEIKLVEDA
jgi:hypothetical protein